MKAIQYKINSQKKLISRLQTCPIQNATLISKANKRLLSLQESLEESKYKQQ